MVSLSAARIHEPDIIAVILRACGEAAAAQAHQYLVIGKGGAGVADRDFAGVRPGSAAAV